MQFNRGNYQLADAAVLGTAGDYADSASPAIADEMAPVDSSLSTNTEPIIYCSQFKDCMEMSAAAETVTAYLDLHQDWFQRCAHPMRVEAIGPNAYALGIGRFGAFGYDVEPKIGLELLPQSQGIFRIVTVPIPQAANLGYSVDFQAAMHLVESSAAMTRVEWHLDLTVSIQFPRFIHRLSRTLVQNTGDRLLRQIVRQVSRRLTLKVQQDFHSGLGISLPKSAGRWQASGKTAL
jgi:hypothetical protein